MLADNKYNFLYFLSWICSFVIVVYHYVWFFNIFDYQDNPFLNYLIIRQEYGPNFVWFYWAISGFIFTNSVFDNTSSNFKIFFSKLFKKFYPLHILTLLTICTLQLISYLLLGHTQLEFKHDIYHFILHLFFASDWGLHNGFSFNAPVWFMSILIPIYLFAFFTSKYLVKMRAIFPILIIFLIYIFLPKILNIFFENSQLFNKWQQLAAFNFRQCFFYFYLGSILYFFFNKIISLNLVKFKYSFTLLLLSGAIFSIYLLNFNKFKILEILPSTIMLFSCLIILFANLDYLSNFSFYKINLLNNTSYSIYLWHFPFQVIVLTLFEYYELDIIILKNIIIFLAFIILLILFSFLSYFYYEKPLSNKISCFIKKK